MAGILQYVLLTTTFLLCRRPIDSVRNAIFKTFNKYCLQQQMLLEIFRMTLLATNRIGWLSSIDLFTTTCYPVEERTSRFDNAVPSWLHGDVGHQQVFPLGHGPLLIANALDVDSRHRLKNLTVHCHGLRHSNTEIVISSTASTCTMAPTRHE